MRRIEQDVGEFHNISADPQGNLYVTDCDNDCIQVFSNDGVLLRSFGCDDDGMKKLNKPRGVCVSGQYVYVTNSGGHNEMCQVFTTERDHVTSFGQIENKEDEFNYSRCISGDVDNFMLIINSSFLIC